MSNQKWLSILGTIGLTATSTTSLISCQKPNNNKNGGGNKPEPPYNPKQPPENSNWKLIDTNTSNWISNNEFPSNKNKWYIMFAILENESLLDLRLIKFKNDDINKPQSLGDKSNFIFLNNKKYWFSWLYRWDGTNEPEIPTVDKDTGKITNWKE